jgi:NAD(P)-dependent dehydrogenase (short-subunit alcohol dehydrogenase family)
LTGSGSFAGKTIIVTGASSGIGEAIATHFGRAGGRVVHTGRDPGRLEAVAAAIRGAGGDCAAVAADLTADGGPQTIVDGALVAHGGIDVLVHSAGIYEPTPIATTPIDALDRAYEINVRAPFALTQAALPHLGAGSAVVFVGSISGHVGFANESAYAATKAAVDGMTRALAVELAASRSIRVNCVAPGFTASPMNARFREESPDIVARAVDSTLSRRLGDVNDVAEAVLYLAAASQVYGVVLPVDGGYPVASIQSGIG